MRDSCGFYLQQNGRTMMIPAIQSGTMPYWTDGASARQLNNEEVDEFLPWYKDLSANQSLQASA